MKTRVQYVDSKIQYGRGRAARALGQTHNIYRMTNQSVSLLSNPPIYTDFPARLRRTTDKKALENATFDLQTFESTCDNRKLLIGDLVQETGYGTDDERGTQYYVASMRPTRETIFVRAESNVTITRPFSRSGTADDMPASGASFEKKKYAGTYLAIEKTLTLQNGSYSFQSKGTPGLNPAQVYAGLQPLNRVRDGTKPKDLPTALYREHFLVYCPLLLGEQLNELDRFNFPNSDRYEIMLIHSTEHVGIAGYVLIVEKLAN